MPPSAPDAPSPESTTVQLQVFVFSVLRDELGTDALAVTLDAPATGHDLLDHLAAENASVEAYRSTIRLAVNESYVPADTRLHDGDEVALITPVSGG